MWRSCGGGEAHNTDESSRGRLIAFLLRHRAALAGATALAGVAVDHPNALPFLAGYMAPLFLFAPLWARLRLRRTPTRLIHRTKKPLPVRGSGFFA